MTTVEEFVHAPRVSGLVAHWIQKALRTSTHSVRSRPQSQGVVWCRFVFRVSGTISPIQDPAYAPLSAHNPY